MENKKFIMVCSCSALADRARKNYIEQFGEPLPHIYQGRDPIRELIHSLDGTNAVDYVKAVYRTNRFAYYFELDDNHNISRVYDLSAKRFIF